MSVVACVGYDHIYNDHEVMMMMMKMAIKIVGKL